jgi:hypothetical protein
MALEQKPSYLRRKLIIYPNIQIPLILGAAGLSFLGSLFTTAFILRLQNTADFTELKTKIIFALGGMVIYTAYSILLAYFTNRLFGPIYRLHMTIKKSANGEVMPPIRLRKGDRFLDLIDDYNRLMESKSEKK